MISNNSLNWTTSLSNDKDVKMPTHQQTTEYAEPGYLECKASTKMLAKVIYQNRQDCGSKTNWSPMMK